MFHRDAATRFSFIRWLVVKISEFFGAGSKQQQLLLSIIDGTDCDINWSLFDLLNSQIFVWITQRKQKLNDFLCTLNIKLTVHKYFKLSFNCARLSMRLDCPISRSLPLEISIQAMLISVRTTSITDKWQIAEPIKAKLHCGKSANAALNLT